MAAAGINPDYKLSDTKHIYALANYAFEIRELIHAFDEETDHNFFLRIGE